MTPIIRKFVIKLLSKDQGSGITKLPGQMQTGFQESIITEKLVRNGYDPRTIESETELKIILNRIDATVKQSKEQKEKSNSKSPLLPGHLTSYLLNFLTNFWVYHYFHVFKDFRKLNSIWNYVFWCPWHPRTS